MTRRPALRVVPTPEQRRSRRLQREVAAIVRRHLEQARDRAWAEVAERSGRPALLALNDPVAAPAKAASRALVGLLTDSLTRLAIAALVPSPRRQHPPRRTTPPPRLSAVQGGRRRESPISR